MQMGPAIAEPEPARGPETAAATAADQAAGPPAAAAEQEKLLQLAFGTQASLQRRFFVVVTAALHTAAEGRAMCSSAFSCRARYGANYRSLRISSAEVPPRVRVMVTRVLYLRSCLPQTRLPGVAAGPG